VSALDEHLCTASMSFLYSRDDVRVAKAAGDVRRLREIERVLSANEAMLKHVRNCMSNGPTLDFFLLLGARVVAISKAENMHLEEEISLMPVDSFLTVDPLELGTGTGKANNPWTVLAANWAFSGFPRINVGHKLAASLMCTTMPEEHRERLEFPWATFVIDVPDGMLPVVDVKKGFQRVDGAFWHHLIVCRHQGSCQVLALCRTGLKAVMVLKSSDIGSLVTDTEKCPPELHLVARYVVGVVAELSEYRRSPDGRRAMEAVSKGARRITTFQLSRDVRVDCRWSRRCASGGERA
jgi:hypothetical protein